jgi:hypothetical protein
MTQRRSAARVADRPIAAFHFPESTSLKLPFMLYKSLRATLLFRR